MIVQGFAPGIRLGLTLTSLVLLSARSFADKPCVALNHYGMRAVAFGLLSLRHVHFVHQVHQVHLAKCFVTKTCASAFDRAPGIVSKNHFLGVKTGKKWIFLLFFVKIFSLYKKKTLTNVFFSAIVKTYAR